MIRITLDQAKEVADIIQSLGIGIGSFLGGFGALKILGDWLDKKRAVRNKKKLLRLYPKSGLGQDFVLVRHNYSKDPVRPGEARVVGSSNHVYLCDKRAFAKHWVANMETLEALGFNSGEVQGVSKKEIDEYANSSPIDLVSA
ncbi:MAG TPA: hypothetical protein VLF40_00315 [Candidatus Saccharimonadales bacterium]|nr:hypothetical protein [Candidatus Saccharimonadales bacterium]